MKISNGGDLATRISENKPASVSTSPMVKPHGRIRRRKQAQVPFAKAKAEGESPNSW